MRGLTGFVIGLSVLGGLADILGGDWKGGISNLCFAWVFFEWDSATRKVRTLESANQALIESVRRRSP